MAVLHNHESTLDLSATSHTLPNRSSITHIHFRRREASHSTSSQSKYRNSSAERGFDQHQPSTLHIITSTAPETIHNLKTGSPSRTPSNSTPTKFALPRHSQASLSRISTAGRPPRSRTRWRNSLDPRQCRTEQAPSNKFNIRMKTIPRRFLVLSNQEDEELQAALDLAEVALGETNVDDAPDELDKTVNNSAPPIPCGCGPSPTAALIISCSTPHKERSYVISA
ncbi:hypothetical protein CF327_g3090 [Tilletia walkeri]|nr:hypothetical protein CF327_g3090 [Tilletia walkeri]